MNEIVDALKSVRDIYVNYPKRYTMLQEQLKTIDKEIQDLLHVAELVNFNASKGYEIAKELQKARKERRIIKDELELLEVVQDLLSYQKPTEKVLNKAIGETRTIIQRHSNRSYKMRVRDDLQELVNK